MALMMSKRGPLSPEEWALIHLHTVEGEAMLAQVGGLLGSVGRIVRSCHERWDGAGYPDGLAGDEIPQVARIVMCCDAFSAMTTDRSYRRALPLNVALEELRANAGTQFDPAVVAALLAVLERLPAPNPSADAHTWAFPPWPASACTTTARLSRQTGSGSAVGAVRLRRLRATFAV